MMLFFSYYRIVLYAALVIGMALQYRFFQANRVRLVLLVLVAFFFSPIISLSLSSGLIASTPENRLRFDVFATIVSTILLIVTWLPLLWRRAK